MLATISKHAKNKLLFCLDVDLNQTLAPPVDHSVTPTRCPLVDQRLCYTLGRDAGLLALSVLSINMSVMMVIKM